MSKAFFGGIIVGIAIAIVERLIYAFRQQNYLEHGPANNTHLNQECAYCLEEIRGGRTCNLECGHPIHENCYGSVKYCRRCR